MPNVFLPFFPFVNGTIISADEMNADLAALRDGTLSVTGDVINGPITFFPDNLYDIGEPTDKRPRNVYIGTGLFVPTITANTLLGVQNTNTDNLECGTAEIDQVNAHVGVSSPVFLGGTGTFTGGSHLNATFSGSFSGNGAGLSNVAHQGSNETISGTWTFTAPIWMQSTAPFINFNESDYVADYRVWRFLADQGVFNFQTVNDASTVVGSIFRIGRTGVVPHVMHIDATQLLVALGSMAVPSLAFTDDPDTGFFLSSAGVIYVTLQGKSRIALNGSEADVTQLVVNNASGTRAVTINSGTSGGPAEFPSVVAGEAAMYGGSAIVSPQFSLSAGNYGTGYGPNVLLAQNINGTGAAPAITFTSRTGTGNHLWVDNTGLLRIHTVRPSAGTVATDVAGVIVGTQSSSADVKDILGLGIAPVEALAKVLATPVYRFRYLQTFPGEEFDGIVTDDAPHFGMDQGKSLNLPNVVGYLVQAIKALQARIVSLERELPYA